MTDNTIPKTDEESIKNNCINLLTAMGYTFIPTAEMKKQRGNNATNVLLKGILLQQLQKINSFDYKGINYPFSPKNLNNAIISLDMPMHQGLLTTNNNITDQLLLGNSYKEELADGVLKSFSLKYIDFDNPDNNVFHFTEEYSVARNKQSESKKNRRPDLVLFINGIPIVVIELKQSGINTKHGISQMLRNQATDEIPNLFKFIQITLAGNNHSPKYATVGTEKDFYSIWREDDQDHNNKQLNKWITNRTVCPLDKMIFSLFSPHRLCDLINNYILFDKKIKRIARYPQYFAAVKTLNQVKNYTLGKRNGGLIWHTQGSGKSLTMVILCKLLKIKFPASRVIVVTDRIDLDDQIHKTFIHSEISAHRAKSANNLIELLQSGKSVITTLIHKFESVAQQKTVLDSSDIFILVDESHRTQGGDLHRAMKKVFPNSCYLGFTGTPLMKEEKKNTITKFGGLLHQYSIDQAVKDKIILPLLYEGRLVDQWIDNDTAMDRRFESISKHLNDEQTRDLKSKWSRFQRVASTEKRLEMIMFDIDNYFNKNILGTKFKGMFATNSRFEAIKYHKLFKEHSEIKTAFVISSPDTRSGFNTIDNDPDEIEDNKAIINHEWKKIIDIYGNEEKYLKKIKSDFKHTDKIDLLIVVDKLLTGFDAPRAAILFIDKALKEHSLLQAIARVNRLHEGKDFGFIIDYRGLLGDLDDALSSYSSLEGFDENDLTSAVINIKDEIAKLKTFYSHLADIFKDIAHKNDLESYEVHLKEKALRNDFYNYLSQFSRALMLSISSDKLSEVCSDEEVNNYKKKMKFYKQLRANIKLRYHEQVDFGHYETQMQKLLDTYISADEVNQLTQLVNIFDEEFDDEINRVIGDNAKADTILSATTAIIQERAASNPAFYEKLSKKIKAIIEAYKENRLSEEEKLKSAKDVRRMLNTEELSDSNDYPSPIANCKKSIAFFDNIKPIMLLKSTNVKLTGSAVAESHGQYNTTVKTEIIVDVVLKIVQIFENIQKRPDWTNNPEVKNIIDGKIEELLWQIEDDFNLKFDNTETIVGIARNIGINHYGK